MNPIKFHATPKGSHLMTRKPETPEEMIKAIIILASDKRGRVVMGDHIEWLEYKLKEIRRIATRLKKEFKLKETLGGR